MLEIAKGNVPRHSVVNKFGSNPSVTANTEEDIWDGGGTYVWPTTADITHIRQATDQVGTDANATIEVQGLDTNWALVTQTVDLDGTDTTTPVALGTALKRVFRMKVLENIVLAADVELRNVGGGTTYAIITAGNNQTLMALYTVAAGYSAYMVNMFFSVIDATNKTPTSTEFRIWAADRENGYEFQLKHADAVPEAGGGHDHEWKPYYRFDQKTDIRLSAEPIDEDGHVHAGFDLILVQD
jgi:hypothetical protein